MSQSIPIKLSDLPPPVLSRDQEVWIRAWAAVASAENCMKADTAAAWAGKCLSAFRSEFGRE